MEDVTSKVLGNLPAGSLSEEKIEELINALEAEAINGTNYTAEIKSFFEGNEYYLFVYETYSDVRLVGAPPSSVGKFGGDTDNWMWPRHTGDFSMFRIYTGPDGKPAEYSKDNIPFKAKYHLPISLKGVRKNDYSMVFGYPGGTERYMPSAGVRMTYEQSNPLKIKIRETILGIMKKDMDASPEIKIKYAAKYAHISNYYKYFIGQNQGLRNLNIIQKKKAQEEDFQKWVSADPVRQSAYGSILSDYDKVYSFYQKFNPDYVFLEEIIQQTEIIMLAYKLNGYYALLQSNPSPEDLKAGTAEVQKLAEEHFKDYNAATDKKIFAAALKMYYDGISKEFHPSIFIQVEKKYKGDFNRFAEDVFKRSILSSKEKLNAFLAKPDAKIMQKDPGFQTEYSILNDFREKAGPSLGAAMAKLESTNRLYVKAIMEMKKDQKLYPDANFTMRLTYGTIQDYYPRDAVHYNYFTTLKGIMEKEDSTNEEFIVPAKLKTLYKNKDFGKYADSTGTIPVCFISNNDITGGNSGSPVIDGEGHLIGIAFDGNWEAMSGDIVYEPNLQRCISVDIRYVLFMIDKYAGAGHLIKEMTLVENNSEVGMQKVETNKSVPVIEKPKNKKTAN
jgi:hypothetical protein